MPNEIVTWIDTNGTEYILTDQEDITITIGPSGRYMPPVETTEEEVPFHYGSRPKQTKIKSREIDLPMEINGQTQMDIRYKLRELTRVFNPLKGDGILKSISPDGSQREIKCRYQSGLEINESGRVWEKFVLVLKAFDPFWYDTNTIVQTFKINESPGLFFPILPLRLASSTVFADVVITNNGDVETWPEWILTGPGENIVFRNLTTGEVVELEVVLELGETLTIDTRPFRKTVTKNRQNYFYTLSDDSSLWAIQPGENSIQLEMGNATSDSNIQLSYRPRYWGP